MFFEGRVSDGRATHPLPTRLFEHDLPLRSAESNTAALRGTVVDSVGLPLSGVQVDVVGWDLTARTDVAGTFTLVGLPPGTPSVRFRKLGLQQADVVVTLWHDQLGPGGRGAG